MFWQPSPQYGRVAPQKPSLLQQLPKIDPVQVWPVFSPHLPSWLTMVSDDDGSSDAGRALARPNKSDQTMVLIVLVCFRGSMTWTRRGAIEINGR